MAHGICENDTMFSANGIRPWHGLGTVIQDAPTSDEAIKLANLGWDVIQEPLFLSDGTQVDNVFANVREDTKQVLGTVKGRYSIVQNREAFKFVDNIIENAKGIPCRYETAGSLFNGKRVFMLVRLEDMELVGDKVENYLYVTTSHDGTTGLMAGISNVRVVCNNTLQLAMREAKRTWNLRHTESIKGKQAEAEMALGLALNYNERLQQEAWTMASQKINEEKFFREFFKKLNGSEKTNEKILTEIRDIYTDKDDLQNFRGTAWGALNAVADFVSNREPMRKTATIADWKMSQFMTGYELNRFAQETLKAIA